MPRPIRGANRSPRPAIRRSSPPNGLLLLGNPQAGWPVDARRRNLQLAADGGDVTYSIAIVGTLTADASGSGSGSGE